MKSIQLKSLGEAIDALLKGKKIAEYNWNGYEYLHFVNGQIKDENNNVVSGTVFDDNIEGDWFIVEQ